MAGFLARIVGGLLRDRTLQAGTGITITNPAGDAGDPTISATNTNTGTVTNTTGALTLNQIVLGNGGSDIKPQGSLGTATTLLHGNAAGAPAFSAVALASDVSGTLADGNLSSNVALKNINNHMVAQSWVSGNLTQDNNPTTYWYDNLMGANLHYWRIVASGGFLFFQPLDDSLVALANFNIDRTANISSFGGQIVFPGTQNPSSNVNTLDDYEEGTWTPSDSVGFVSMAGSVGDYVKIGKHVTITAVLNIAANGAVGVPIVIAGLPFTAKAQQPGGGGAPIYTNYTATQLLVYVRESSTHIELFDNAGNSITWIAMSAKLAIISATYIASA